MTNIIHRKVNRSNGQVIQISGHYEWIRVHIISSCLAVKPQYRGKLIRLEAMCLDPSKVNSFAPPWQIPFALMYADTIFDDNLTFCLWSRDFTILHDIKTMFNGKRPLQPEEITNATRFMAFPPSALFVGFSKDNYDELLI